MIEPIKNDDDLVKVIDELKHQLKPGASNAVLNVLCREFNHVLNDFISRWQLGEGQHTFAELPTLWPTLVALRCPSCLGAQMMHRMRERSGVYRCEKCHNNWWVPMGLSEFNEALSRSTSAIQLEKAAEEPDDEGWGGPFGH